MPRMFRLQSSALLLVTVVMAGMWTTNASAQVRGYDSEWFIDQPAQAQNQAKSSNKYMFLFFTGSDWCGWCDKLDDEVFEESYFKDEIKKEFVLLALDYPRNRYQPDDVKAANKRLKDQFNITGYPTVYLTDSDGNPFAKSGYRPGGGRAYIEFLVPLVQAKRRHDDLLAQARRIDDPAEKAKLLDRALSVYKELQLDEQAAFIIWNEKELAKELVTLDEDGKLGLASKWRRTAGMPAKDDDKKVDKDEEPGDEATEPEEVVSPFESAMRGYEKRLTDKKTATEVLKEIRDVERRERLRGADAARLLEVKMKATNAIGNERGAAKQLAKAVRSKAYPAESRQRLGRLHAETLLKLKNPEAAIKAWDAAIALDDASATAEELRKARAAFVKKAGGEDSRRGRTRGRNRG